MKVLIVNAFIPLWFNTINCYREQQAWVWNIEAHSILYNGLILLNSAGDAFTIVAYSIKV